MGVLTAIIENWAQNHGIKAYTLRHETLTKEQFASRLVCTPGCAFFYKFEADGEINHTADLSLPLFQIKTHDDYLDLGVMVMRNDNGTIQKAESNFCFVCDNEAKFTLHEGDLQSQFASIFNACLHYVQLMPCEAAPKDDRFVHVQL